MTLNNKNNKWLKLSTATVSDALDKLGIKGQCLDIKPISDSFKAVGKAFTVKMSPVTSKSGTVGDYIDDLDTDHIVVIDSYGRMDATVWGDILTITAHKKRIAGTIINGVCRDIYKCKELNYPIFSKGIYMRTGKDRLKVDALNVPVLLSGVEVQPGDILLGDHDGVVVIPKDREDEVMKFALEIEGNEKKIIEAILQGTRLDEARQKFNYHKLQSRTGVL